MQPNPAILQQRLPSCPPPACKACRHPLHDVRPYRASQPHARLVLVHALARCECCSTRHIGVRALAPIGTRLRYIHQAFDRYTDDRKAELEQVAAYLHQGEDALDPNPDPPYPSQPVFAVWFANTTNDPERAAPYAPATGLPAQALREEEGVQAIERRTLHDGTLTGVLLRFDSPRLALTWLEQLRIAARMSGTIAWCRRYDQADVAVAWDTHTPAMGNPYQPTHGDTHASPPA